MIVAQNVCDRCGECKYILKKDGQLMFYFFSENLYNKLEQEKTDLPLFSRKKPNYEEATFCSKECLVQFVKDNINEEGDLINRKVEKDV